MGPDELLELLARDRTTAIIRSDDEDIARRAMDAAVRGGIHVIEFTMTTPGCLRLIEEFAARDGVVVGAGTVMTVDDARRAVDAGARFLVSPIVDEAVIAEALALGVAAVPGTYTPTEMVRAQRAGAHLQKVFPELAGGPDALRSILGPLPTLRLMPTNGVTLDNVAEYLSAGAYACGFVRALFHPDDLAFARWDAITARAAGLLAAARRK